MYDLSVMAEICAVACVDHDSPADAPEPFFDGGVKQALELDTDRLTLLYQAFSEWSATCNPRRVNMSIADYMETVTALALTEDGDDRFFDSLGSVMLRVCARTMARQLVISREPKSPSTSASEPATTTG